MRLAQAILAATFLAISNQHEISKRSSDGEKKVVCYYTNWSVYRPGTAKFNPQNINPYLCTHLIYAFGGLDRENGLRPYDKYQDIEQGGYAKFTGLKTYNKQLKTLLAIGGWNEGSARFSPLVADEERRKEFVRNVVKFLRQNHFDGLDLDWEYPAYRDGGKPKDKENYAQLVQELREEFEKESSKTGRPRLLLTMAVPAGIEYIDKGYDLPKLNRYLDFFNILSYDYHSAFEPSVNHHSPLYSIEEDSEYNFDSQLTIEATIKHYLMKGADAEKLVLGIPTYGRSYTLFNPDSTDLGSPADGPGEQGEATREKGYLAYYEICNNIKDGWTVVQPKESAMGPYAYKDNQWVGYDDEAIARKKAEYVNQRNLGGIMFWSIDNDDFRGKTNKVGKIKTTARTTTTPSPPQSNTTPEPPTTPDPGSDFVCKDEGFFPHPRDCKKYFWCLDSGPSDLGIVAHQFTCPSGLFFNKAADSCDFSRNVICNKKSATTTTTTTTVTPKTTKASPGKITLPPKTTSLPRTTTTTTTTTTEAPIEEEEEEEDRDNAEDPQAIKQLIALIKKLGGVAELEKQLEASSGTDSTPPPISKSLYRKVLNSGTSRYQSIQRNGPSGPQNEGLPRESPRSSFRRDKPQYVTIRRERPSTTTESADIVYAEVEDDGGVEEEGVKYKTINRNRFGQNSGASETEKPERPKYQPSERFRSKHRNEEAPRNEERSTTLKYTSILRSRPTTADSSSTTSKYVTLQRQRTPNPHAEEDVVTTENELNDDEEVTEHVIETTTPRPRVKVSDDVIPTTITIPTSTRVVTQVVEGATRRQRVPLSKLRNLIKDLENSVVDLYNVENKSLSTEDETIERPLLHGFHLRRPDISVTTTARATPAFLSQKRFRLRTTTEQSETSSRGHFVPSKARIRTTESNPADTHSLSPAQQTENSEEPSDKGGSDIRLFNTARKRYPLSSRFPLRRKPNEKLYNLTNINSRPNSEDEDELFVKGDSRDTNVIRKPIFKPRFPPRRGPTTPSHISSTTTLPTSDEIVTEPRSTTSLSLDDSTFDELYQTGSTINDLLSDTFSDKTKVNNVESKTEADLSLGDIVTESILKEITTDSDLETTTNSSDSFEMNNSSVSTPKNVIRNRFPSYLNINRRSTTTPTPEAKTLDLIPKKIKEGRRFENRDDDKTFTVNKNIGTGPELSGKKKVILRRRKPSIVNSTVPINDNAVRSNRNSLVIRRKISQQYDYSVVNSTNNILETKPSRKPYILKRGRKKYADNVQNDDTSQLIDNLASSSKEGVNLKFYVNNQSTSNPDSLPTNTSSIKHKRIIIRGRKRFNANLNVTRYDKDNVTKDLNDIKFFDIQKNNETEISQVNTTKNGEDILKHKHKVRKVILRKPIKDLEVEETGSLEKAGLFKNTNPLNRPSQIKLANVASNDDLNVDFSEDVIQTSRGEQEIQTRTRRPFRKTIVRAQTTSTTEAPTTVKQRTTIESLRQRLNRFKTERNFSKNSITSPSPFSKEFTSAISENVSQTSKPVRKEFRKLIRPLPLDDSQLDASHDVSKNTPQNEIRTRKVSKPLEQVTEGSQLSEEYTDEEPLVLPDLANVAVAAIQSLATSSPIPTTQQYKSSTTERTTRKAIVRKRPAVRPTVSTPPKSSPRPFSKIQYDEYDDYFAEPVDVPLSGKVRIHNDGYIECLDIGNFPHPFSCRKFISCAKMENANLLGWEYTCPKGLSFDPIGGICNWNAGLGCKE
ncbi:unnamed protein product [Nezara viridula]|uniref:Chitinase n=1 Tax=Nezara viridula TaxID=85310 RepID=A0A9P0HJ00_NEZVI|nr:unnamed protein product [Nezara viridula]